MPRPLRRYRPGEVVEVTSRTIHGRFSFAPLPNLVLEWIGILAEACERWPAVKLHMGIAMSGHWHGLASSHDANITSRWLSFVDAAVARAAQFHHNLKGPIWGRRPRVIPILDDIALRNRVKYLMAQACSAGCDLVEAPRHWPGFHCVDALCRGVTLIGSYVTADERRRALRETGKLPLNRVLELTPLPGLPEESHKRETWFRHIEQEVIAEARERRERTGKRCKSRESLQNESPHSVPKHLAKSAAPLCHVSCRDRMKAFRKAWEFFEEQWREALEDFKRNLRACFPAGSWWPYHCRECWTPQLE